MPYVWIKAMISLLFVYITCMQNAFTLYTTFFGFNLIAINVFKRLSKSVNQISIFLLYGQNTIKWTNNFSVKKSNRPKIETKRNKLRHHTSQEFDASWEEKQAWKKVGETLLIHKTLIMLILPCYHFSHISYFCFWFVGMKAKIWAKCRKVGYDWKYWKIHLS